MNGINQASNYIKAENKYDMIYTINITCMMVLASVYISVSANLPTTSTIKPIELWLIANLAYPFVVILSNIILQVKLISIISTVKTRRIQVWKISHNWYIFKVVKLINFTAFYNDL